MPYRFERLLDLASYEQKRRAAMYAASLEEARLRKERYEQEVKGLQALLDTMQDNATEGMPLSVYQAYVTRAWGIKDQLLELKREVDVAHVRMQQSEKALYEQRAEKQKYEHLKERWKIEEGRLDRLQEQRALDEVALTKHQRYRYPR